MATLLIRLAGPMQSWGTESRWEVRDTGREPSKSGVVGLLAAALGRRREESVEDLARLRMGVRVEQEGMLQRDFQTAGEVSTAEGGKSRSVISGRYYLSDAEFLVGLEGELALLKELETALESPVYPLYLGRKSYPPSVPVRLPDGLVPSTSLGDALRRHQWEPMQGSQAPPSQLKVVEECTESVGTGVRRDQPIGACFSTREFGLRHVMVYWVDTPVRSKGTPGA